MIHIVRRSLTLRILVSTSAMQLSQVFFLNIKYLLMFFYIIFTVFFLQFLP